MKKLLVFLILSINTTIYAQVVCLLDESFESELSEAWSHCSGNWGEFQVWDTSDGYLQESSGPYFVQVLNGLLLPSVELEGLENLTLEFEYSLGEMDSITQLSIYYTASDSCITMWDTLNSTYLLEDWHLIANYGKTNDISNNTWVPNDTDFVSIQIELDSILTDTSVRIGIVSDYKNYVASGKWYINNLSICGESSLRINEYVKNNNGIVVYPNPAHETVNVILDEGPNQYKLSIFNSVGQLVFESSVFENNYTIDISDYAKGIYSLHCVRSSKILTSKFIIE